MLLALLLTFIFVNAVSLLIISVIESIERNGKEDKEHE